MMKSVILASALATASISTNAGNFYVLGDMGQSKLEISFEGASASQSNTLYDLGIAYGLNEIFAIELAYRDLGGMDGPDPVHYSVDVTSLQLSAIGMLPVGDSVYLYGRLGMARLNADTTYEHYSVLLDNGSGNGPGIGFGNDSSSTSKTKALIGFGMGYKVNEAFNVRTEYIQHAKWEDVTLSSITVGATYSF